MIDVIDRFSKITNIDKGDIIELFLDCDLKDGIEILDTSDCVNLIANVPERFCFAILTIRCMEDGLAECYIMPIQIMGSIPEHKKRIARKYLYALKDYIDTDICLLMDDDMEFLDFIPLEPTKVFAEMVKIEEIVSSFISELSS